MLVINLIAQNTSTPFKTISKATLSVMLVKAAVSIHTPWPAYIAVGFQGFLGAVCYAFFSVNLFSNTLFAIIALVESALQKVIITTLIFGKSIWDALDIFFNKLIKDFGLSEPIPFSIWIIAFYVGIYVVWGFILGILMMNLPQKIEKYKETVLRHFVSLEDTTIKEKSSKNYFYKLTGLFFILFFIVTVFIFSNISNVWYVVLRTFGAIFILYGLLAPTFKWYIKQLQEKNKNNKRLINILVQLPKFKQYTYAAKQLAFCNGTSIKSSVRFVVYMLILTIYATENDEE